MWALVNGLRGTRRGGRATGVVRTLPMLIGAGVGIAAWELVKRQNYPWFDRIMELSGNRRRRLRRRQSPELAQ